jgi:hypothetical protein
VHGPGGETLRHRHARFLERVGCDHVVDEAQAVGVLGREEIPAHEVLLGAVDAEQHRPQHTTAVTGDETGLHVRITDAGRRRHEDDVAEERERRTDPERVTVDDRDHRLTHAQDAARDVGAVGEHVGTAVGIAAGGQVVLHLLEVGAYTERPPAIRS